MRVFACVFFFGRIFVACVTILKACKCPWVPLFSCDNFRWWGKFPPPPALCPRLCVFRPYFLYLKGRVCKRIRRRNRTCLCENVYIWMRVCVSQGMYIYVCVCASSLATNHERPSGRPGLHAWTPGLGVPLYETADAAVTATFLDEAPVWNVAGAIEDLSSGGSQPSAFPLISEPAHRPLEFRIARGVPPNPRVLSAAFFWPAHALPKGVFKQGPDTMDTADSTMSQLGNGQRPHHTSASQRPLNS